MTITKHYLRAGLISFLLIASLFSTAQTNAQRFSSALDWPQITSQNKPWTRWWWLGSIVNKADLTAEMEKYKQAGLGGLEITPIYGVKGSEDRFINFLSPQWMNALEHTLSEASRLGMGVDMANGTGWPFGGPWIGDEDASKYLTFKSWSLKSGQQLNEAVSFTQKPIVRMAAPGRRVKITELKDPVSSNPNQQALALDQVRFEKPLPMVSLMAYSDAGVTLDLTSKVGASGKLDWVAPAGAWTLYAVFQGWHGKQVERAAPGGEGNVIDHFSAVALKNYLRKFDLAFAGRNLKSLRGFFNDSYEVDDADGESNFTPGFLDEFKRRRGYDLRLHFPALFGRDTEEKNSRVLTDFRETISDLLLDQFTVPWREWAAGISAGKGKIVRNQAHGAPANILDLYAASDIPETEGSDILRMKFASSAAHVTGKPLASAEAATWLGEHFQSTLGDAKKSVDGYFLGGINHVCYHGTPFSPASEAWPGFMFYASVHFGVTNSFWNDFSALNRYVARTQSFLQSGKPDSDVLLYYPIYEDWAKRGKTLLQHYGGGHDSGMSQAEGQSLLNAGYSFDFVSDRQLRNVTFNKLLQTGGSNYQAIVLPETKIIPLETFKNILALAERGATVIVNKNLPTDVSGFDKLEARRSEFQKLIAQIKFVKTDNSAIQSAKVGAGRFLLGSDLNQTLAFAGIKRETMTDQGLKFVRRADTSGKFYFVINQSNTPIDGWVRLQTAAGSVAVFDPMRETKGLAAMKTADGSTEVYLQLAPGESRIIKTFKAAVNGARLDYFSATGAAEPLAGKWSVKFVAGGPELPAAVEIDRLTSWTNFGGQQVKNFSGTATYSISFAKPAANAAGWLLDLGRVAESARVKLNGKERGVLIAAPFQIRLSTAELKPQNTLEISVSNLMANRIADMDRRGVAWKRFYNVNMSARKRENLGDDGLFTAAKWEPMESGLIGPVTITPLEIRQTKP